MRYTLLMYLLVLFYSCESNRLDYKDLNIIDDYRKGILLAKKTNQNILLMFDIHANSNLPTKRLLIDEDVNKFASNFVCILLYTDDRVLFKDKTVGYYNTELQKGKYHTKYQPVHYIIDTNETIINGPKEYCQKQEFISFLQERND